MKNLPAFDKKDSQTAKGFAISFMLLHHLFAYSRISLPYFTIFPDISLPVLFLLSRFGNICVSVFILLSGFGIYRVSLHTNLRRWSLSHFIHFILQYELVFAIFIPLGFIYFKRTFVIKEFLENIFLLSYSYNKEWWFIRIYLEILLLSPLLISLYKKQKNIFLLVSFLFSAVGLILRYLPLDQALLKECSNLFLWQFLFVIGIFAASYNLFEHMLDWFCRHHLHHFYVYFFLLILCVLIRQEPFITAKLKDPILAPAFIFLIVNLSKCLSIDRCFAFLGNHSLYMWLTHTFFCYYYTPRLVFFPQYAPFIFLWFLLLSLAASIMLTMLQRIIMKGLKKCRIRKTTKHAPC